MWQYFRLTKLPIYGQTDNVGLEEIGQKALTLKN